MYIYLGKNSWENRDKTCNKITKTKNARRKLNENRTLGNAQTYKNKPK